jgi:hypothetical protein
MAGDYKTSSRASQEKFSKISQLVSLSESGRAPSSFLSFV